MRVGVDCVEVVRAGSALLYLVGEVGVRYGGGLHHGVGAGLVKRDGVVRGEEADVRHHSRVVLRVAVAEGRDVHDGGDVEVRLSVDYGLRVLRHLAADGSLRALPVRLHRVEGTSADAAAAAYAFFVVDMRLALGYPYRLLRAVPGAAAAAYALGLVDRGLAVAVHLHLAAARAGAHAEVLNRAAEARYLVALEVRQRDYHVGVGYRAAYLRFLYILAAIDGDERLVGALQAVGYDDVAACAEGVVAVLVGGIEVLERVLPAPDVERVAVGQKRLAAELLDLVRDDLREVRAQVGDVARLAEMYLYRRELLFEIDLLNPGPLYERAEFLQKVPLGRGPHISEINDRTSHVFSSVVRSRGLFLNTLRLSYNIKRTQGKTDAPQLSAVILVK